MSVKLFYVRHGKTQGNLDKVYVGRTESPLLPEGIEGAKTVGAEIRASGQHIDVMYASRLERVFDTAKTIAHEIGYPVDSIVLTDLLLERAGGTFEGRPQADFFAATAEEQRAAGAESFEDLADRSVAMINLAKTEHPTSTVLLVGSAAIGEMMRAMCMYNDHTRMFDDGPLPNTTLVQFI